MIPLAHLLAFEAIKNLGIPHAVSESYDIVTDRLLLRMSHKDKQKEAFDAIDFPYSVSDLCDKLKQMQKALEAE